MKVLHVHNLAGFSSNLAFFQRKLGLKSIVITKTHHPFGYEEQCYSTWNPIAFKHFLTSTIIHYHSEFWLRKKQFSHVDYRLCKKLGKKTLIQFHGSDLRLASKHIELKSILEGMETILVSTPDLLKYLSPKKGRWVPFPIKMNIWDANHKPQTTKIAIGYYVPPFLTTYDERIYTVRHIRLAIDALKKKGFDVEDKPVWGKLHCEMPSYYSSLDVFVDRLGMGWYGTSACEAMASGTPVITNVDESLLHFLPAKKPFIVSSKETLQANLEKLISDKELRDEFAHRGREYVLEVHEGLKIARSLLKLYHD